MNRICRQILEGLCLNNRGKRTWTRQSKKTEGRGDASFRLYKGRVPSRAFAEGSIVPFGVFGLNYRDVAHHISLTVYDSTRSEPAIYPADK